MNHAKTSFSTDIVAGAIISRIPKPHTKAGIFNLNSGSAPGCARRLVPSPVAVNEGTGSYLAGGRCAAFLGC
jgi:hypothetical protein